MSLTTGPVAQQSSSVQVRQHSLSEPDLKKYLHEAKIAILNSKSFSSDNKPIYDLVIAELKKGVDISFSADGKLHVEKNAEGRLKLSIPVGNVRDLTSAKKIFFKSLYFALNKDANAEKFNALYPTVVFPSDSEVEDAYINELVSEVLEEVALSDYDKKRNMEEGARMAKDEASSSRSIPKDNIEINSKLFAKIARFYPSSPKDVWKGYSGELSQALDRGEEATGAVLVDILNSFYLLQARISSQNDGEGISAFYKRVSDVLLKDLNVSLLGYFNLAKRGVDTLRPVVLGGMSRVRGDESKLYKQMRGNLQWDEFHSKFSRAEISFTKFKEMEQQLLESASGSSKTLRIAHNTNMAASGVGILALTDGTQRSSSVMLLGYSGDSTESTRSNQEQKKIEVSSEFLELTSAYKLGSTVLETLKTALAPSNLQNRVSLLGVIPQELFLNMDTAYERQCLKQLDPENPLISLQINLDEMAEYLKYLHLISTTTLAPVLKKVCGEVSPQTFFISQFMLAYLDGYLRTKDPEVAKKTEEAYVACLSKLEPENIDFKHIGQLILSLRADEKANAKGKKVAEDKGDAQGIAQARAKERGGLITEASKVMQNNATATRKKPIPSTCPSRRSTDAKDVAVSVDGFIRRLTNPFFIDEETRVLLGNHTDEAKLEIIYLISGIIPLTYVDSGKPIKVCKEGVGFVEMSREQLVRDFERASVRLMSDVHADRVARTNPELVVEVGPDKKTFAKECFAFISDFKGFIDLSTGWSVDVLPKRIDSLLDVYNLSTEKSGEAVEDVSRELSETIRELGGTSPATQKLDRFALLTKRLDVQNEALMLMLEIIASSGVKDPRVEKVKELLSVSSTLKV